MDGNRANILLVRTPEGIAFPLLLAGPITRCLAWVVDFAAVGAASVLAGSVIGVITVLSADLARAAQVLSYFVISIGYGILMEWLWRGQTLGKRLFRLRVMDDRGLNLRFSQVVVRNLLRAVDILPGFYLFGGVACLASRKAQRLGDISAGTIVVRYPPTIEPDLDQILSGKYNSFRDTPHLAARLRQQVSVREAYIALESLLRREELDPAARVELYSDLARHFRAIVEFPEDATFSLTDEQYVRNVVDILFRSSVGFTRGKGILAGACFVLIAVIISASHAFAGFRSEFSAHSLSIAGTERSYLLRVPKALPKGGAPVVVMLHGHGGNAKDLVGEGKPRAAPYRVWTRIADLQGIVLVAPEGLRGRDGKQGWNDCRGDASTNPRDDDVAFLSAVVDAVGREVAIDRKLVFFAGTSNGGHMALRMAIERPERVSAVAAVVASMPARSQCPAPAKPVRVMFMNGTADPLLPFDGGQIAYDGDRRGSVLSTEESADVWRLLAGVSGPPTRILLTDTDPSDKCRVERIRYMNGRLPVVAVYRVTGGGHTEPSGQERYARFYKRIVGEQNGDIEMAREMWDFFSAQ